MTVEAFNLSETYRTPVILLFDEVVGHMRERLDRSGKGRGGAYRTAVDLGPGGN